MTKYCQRATSRATKGKLTVNMQGMWLDKRCSCDFQLPVNVVSMKFLGFTVLNLSCGLVKISSLLIL